MRSNHEARRRAGRWLAAAALASAASVPPHVAAAPEGPNAPQWIDPLISPVDPRAITRLAAEVSIRRSIESPGGQPRGPASQADYHLENTRTGSGWKTVMRRLDARRAVVRVAAGDMDLAVPSAVQRVEHEGDGSPVRVFNQRGVEVRLPSPASLRALAAREPGAVGRLGLPEAGDPLTASAMAVADRLGEGLRGLLVAVRGHAPQRPAAEQRFGPLVERARGLGRHVRVVDDTTIETLVNARTALVEQVSLARNGRVVERTRHTYAEAAGGAALKRAVRAERVVSQGGERVITEVEFRNVRVAVGGAR
jgi:hypothetical protein